MALTVQNDAGTVVNANGYITVAEFKAYHDDRGNSYGADSDALIGSYIVRATDYIDTRFRFSGSKLADGQTTQVPRAEVYDGAGVLIEGIVTDIKAATAEYALKAKTASLYQDTPAPTGGLAVTRKKVKVDVIETETEFASSGAGSPGVAVIGAYPLADGLVYRSGLVLSGQRRTMR